MKVVPDNSNGETNDVEKRIDMLEYSAGGYPSREKEKVCPSSHFGGVSTASHFEEDAITESVYLAFLEDCDERRKRIPH